MSLLNDLTVIANLAEVDEEATKLLNEIDELIAGKLIKFSLKKNIVLSRSFFQFWFCNHPDCDHVIPTTTFFCGKHLIEASEATLQEEATIPITIMIKAGKNKPNVVYSTKAASLPDAYAILGKYAVKHKASYFKEKDGVYWYQSRNGRRKFFLRFPNGKK